MLTPLGAPHSSVVWRMCPWTMSGIHMLGLQILQAAFSALPRIVHLPAHAEQQRAANKAIQTPQNSTHNVTSLSLMIAACQLLASNTTQWSIEDE